MEQEQGENTWTKWEGQKEERSRKSILSTSKLFQSREDKNKIRLIALHKSYMFASKSVSLFKLLFCYANMVPLKHLPSNIAFVLFILKSKSLFKKMQFLIWFNKLNQKDGICHSEIMAGDAMPCTNSFPEAIRGYESLPRTPCRLEEPGIEPLNFRLVDDQLYPNNNNVDWGEQRKFYFCMYKQNKPNFIWLRPTLNQ